ncbi:hypothetical protein GCM10009799_02340 [Nocardiopsis rhodophaea]|uniref:Uncharacterized protein n=1 Tax=Nocardiopsis rhodophaea TaxID=280238 RepID=A0ABN2S5N0_9ACTN
MIVTDTGRAVDGAAMPEGATIWQCLARRGMLHSECEAVDHLILPGGATLDRRGRDGLHEVWLVLSGRAGLGNGTSLAAGQAVLVRAEDTAALLTAETETWLLTLTLLPDSTARRLPVRAPVMLP